MAKTSWTMNDIVQPSDMNQIGTEINQNTANVGNLSNLATTNKANAVAAINEVKGKADSANSLAGEAQSSANGVSSSLIAHSNTTSGAHGATSAATANRLMQRDANGRSKVAAPAASDDIARKAEVDAVQASLDNHAGLTNPHSATSAATANRFGN